MPGLDPKIVLAAGATSIQALIPVDQQAGVILAYNDALHQDLPRLPPPWHRSHHRRSVHRWKRRQGQEDRDGCCVSRRSCLLIKQERKSKST